MFLKTYFDIKTFYNTITLLLKIVIIIELYLFFINKILYISFFSIIFQ